MISNSIFKIVGVFALKRHNTFFSAKQTFTKDEVVRLIDELEQATVQLFEENKSNEQEARVEVQGEMFTRPQNCS